MFQAIEGFRDARRRAGIEQIVAYLTDRSVAILRTADTHDCDLIVTGGYGRPPVAEVFAGSTVDGLLRTSRRPIFICR